jgi:hypothetical protein
VTVLPPLSESEIWSPGRSLEIAVWVAATCHVPVGIAEAPASGRRPEIPQTRERGAIPIVVGDEVTSNSSPRARGESGPRERRWPETGGGRAGVQAVPALPPTGSVQVVKLKVSVEMLLFGPLLTLIT